MRVELDARRRTGADEPVRQTRGPGWISDVEERHLGALGSSLFVRSLADAEQQAVAYRVQVCGVAEQVEAAEHRRMLGVGEADCVERVDLAESHDVRNVAQEAHRVDALALPELADS